MSFKNNLLNQVKSYIDKPENVIDESIRRNCIEVEVLTERQLADLCAIRRNTLRIARRFPYSYDELELIIETIDSNPESSFAKLRDAIRQIEFILEEK